MKKALILFVLALSGCTYYATPFVHQSDLREVDFSKLHEMKTGEACMTRFLVFPVEGDASLSLAALEQIFQV